MREMIRLTSAAVGALMLLASSADAAQSAHPRAGATARPVPSTAGGSIEGIVTDQSGAPVAKASVSVVAGNRTVSALTDDKGHFTLLGLPAGRYLLSARIDGFIAPGPKPIEVRENARASSSVALRRVTLLAAGLGLPVDVPVVPAASGRPAADAAVEDDHPADPDETAWRLRHARRSILKDDSLAGTDFADSTPPNVFAALDTAGRLAADFITETPFSGQVNFLTTGSFESPRELFEQNLMSRGIAFLSLSAPAGTNADWTVRAALTQADVSAWIVAGSYAARPDEARQRGFGASYSTQHYEGGNALALREVTDGSRNVGEIYGYDTVAITPGMSLTYGGRYSQYDYLADPNLLSPRLELVVAADESTKIRGVFTRRTLAPGAEEFLPPGDTGIWLPPQRTFSALEPGRPFNAERAMLASVGIERTFDSTTVGIKAFHQQVDDQLLTIFGVNLPQEPNTTVGHYFVGSAGDAKVTGGTATIGTSIASRVRASVDYSLSVARLHDLNAFRYVVLVSPGSDPVEHIHDLSASVEADVPETSTRVMVLYQVGNGYAQGSPLTGGGTMTHRGRDSRFDIQVRQALPFMDFGTARWQMLVAVRNYFREAATEQSIYDELLVVRPPTRIVGGLTMLF